MTDVQVIVQIRGEAVLAGHLWFHSTARSESATFAYDNGYLAGGHYQLDPGLPLLAGAQHTPTNAVIFGAFSDCAPDRWGRTLVDRQERLRVHTEGRRQRKATEADYLLGVRDELRQGALRFRLRADAPFFADETSGAPLLIELPRLLAASMRLARDEAHEEDLRLLLRGGSSLGGARPKAHVRDGSSVMIAKFPADRHDEWEVPTWESIAMTLARRCGISIPDHRLERIDGKPVLIIDRFDRSDDKRIGYASAMTMLSATDGEHADYLDMAEVIQRDGDRVNDDLHELWRRVVFGRLIANTDDHLRNHGFLRRSDAGWSLSPAFDVNPNPDPDRFSTTLAEADTIEDPDQLLQAAGEFRVSPEDARATVASVGHELQAWRNVAAQHKAQASDIALMETVFESELVRQAAALGRE